MNNPFHLPNLVSFTFCGLLLGGCLNPQTPDDRPVGDLPQWRDLRVAVLGDSISDPNQKNTTYWQYLARWLDWDVRCYGIAGNTWRDLLPQTDRMIAEMGDDVDAILILIGTNDYANGNDLGEWFAESDGQVNWWGENRELKHRDWNLSFEQNVRGSANAALLKLKRRYPRTQIVLLSPTKRAFFTCSDTNVQPAEDWPNIIGLHLEDYAAVTFEAGQIWSCPVIDLGGECGLTPLLKDEYAEFYNSKSCDLLHPNSVGHRRLAQTIYYRLGALPGTFRR